MSVVIPKKVYLTVVAACTRFANMRIPKEQWLEVYGVFIGKIVKDKKGNKVMITQAYPITHQVIRPEDIVDKVYWSDADYEALAIIDSEAFEREEFVVGWWHSHPGFKIMLSGFGDRQTTLSYQTNNPDAIALVFNPLRLLRQLEPASKKGDPDIALKNDPGFVIFRLDDINRGIEASYHAVDYIIDGYENTEQLVKLTQKFIVDITNFFPKEGLLQTYQNFIMERIAQLNSLVAGTEEYLKTLVRKGETSRVPEVLDNQKKEIRKFVAETHIKVENIKEFFDYLEYRERETVIPQVKEILSQWDERVSNLGAKLVELSKKF